MNTKDKMLLMLIGAIGSTFLCCTVIMGIALIYQPTQTPAAPILASQIPIEKIIELTSQSAKIQTAQVSTSAPMATAAPLSTATTFISVLQTSNAAPPQSADCSCSGNTLNCSDFTFRSIAQSCFEYCVSQGYGDLHELDQDGNGSACESLP